MGELYMGVRRYLKSIFSSSPLYVFYSTLLFYLITFFVNRDNKSIVVFLFFLILIHRIVLKRLSHSLVLTFLTSSAFFIGKSYQVQLIPPEFIKSANYPFGWNAQVIITPTQIIGVFLGAYLLRNLLLGKIKFSLTYFLILLSLSSVWVFISSFYSVFPQVSIIYALQNIPGLIVIWFLYLYSGDASDKKIFGQQLLYFFFAFVVFQTVIGGMQFLKTGYVGSSLEASGYVWSGSSIDENEFRFRPLGTTFHPNLLAQILVFLLPVFIAHLYYQSGRLRLITWVGVGSSIALLLFTWGRSAWISAALGILLFFFIVEKQWHCRLNFTQEEKKLGKYFLLILLVVTTITLPERLIRSVYSFGDQASGSTRLEEIQIWISLAMNYPLFGTGVGVSVPVAFRLFRSGVLLYFPEAAHMAYVVVMAESGILAFLLFILIPLGLLRQVWSKLLHFPPNVYSAGIFCGIVGGYINMFFQPYQDGILYIILLSLVLL